MNNTTETAKNELSHNSSSVTVPLEASSLNQIGLEIQNKLLSSTAPELPTAQPPSTQPSGPLTPAPMHENPTPVQRPVFSAAAPENQEHLLDSRLESISRLKRADYFLRSLNPAQSRQLYTWMREFESINEVHERVTAPPPEGLGLTVSTITLRRLRSHWRAMDEASFTRDMLDLITDLEVESELKQPARIQNAICHLLQEKAFDLARTYPGSDTLKLVLTGIEKLTTLDLKRQKLALDRERLLRKPATPIHTPPAAQPTQFHRVDLNIVPPARDPIPVQSAPTGNNVTTQVNFLPPTNPSKLPPPQMRSS